MVHQDTFKAIKKANARILASAPFVLKRIDKIKNPWEVQDDGSMMKSMFTTFKKSNVAKVGSAYVVVAWIVLQLIEVVLPTFEAPTWIGQTIIFVLVLGFPIALILAWASQPKLELEVNGNSPQGSSQVNVPLVRRLVLFGGPSAAVAGLLAFVLFPSNLERETEVSRNLPNASLTLSTDPYNPQTRPVRSSLLLGQTRSRAIGLRSELALSDDGSRLVFNSYGETGGINMIFWNLIL